MKIIAVLIFFVSVIALTKGQLDIVGDCYGTIDCSDEPIPDLTLGDCLCLHDNGAIRVGDECQVL